MCHPIPASPNNRTDKPLKASSASNATNNKSAIDGNSHRTAAGFDFADLMDPIAIALNLIEEKPDRQETIGKKAIDKKRSDRKLSARE
jgi:hypothetical protein